MASTKAKPKPKPKPRSASKLKAKSKPAVKRKATRKAKPNAKPKKVLTAEEKEKLRATRSAKQERLKVKSLKKAALKPPTVRSSSWLVFLKDKTSENKSEGKVPISEVTKRAAVEYKKLTPERLEVTWEFHDRVNSYAEVDYSTTITLQTRRRLLQPLHIVNGSSPTRLRKFVLPTTHEETWRDGVLVLTFRSRTKD